MFKEILTNPNEHNPNDFIYLVHGFLDKSDNEISTQEIKDKVYRVKDPNQFYKASIISRLDKKSAKKRIGWSNGEVYQTDTFNDVGIIIEPARDDLVQIAWNCYLESPSDPKKLERYVQEHKGKIKEPLILLTATKGYNPTRYNELILRGNSNTSVRGVFFKPTDSKTKSKGKLLGKILEEIMQTKMPVIEIPVQPIKKYDNGEDPKEREWNMFLEILRAKGELLQAQVEFYRPDLFKEYLSSDRDR